MFLTIVSYWLLALALISCFLPGRTPVIAAIALALLSALIH